MFQINETIITVTAAALGGGLISGLVVEFIRWLGSGRGAKKQGELEATSMILEGFFAQQKDLNDRLTAYQEELKEARKEYDNAKEEYYELLGKMKLLETEHERCKETSENHQVLENFEEVRN